MKKYSALIMIGAVLLLAVLVGSVSMLRSNTVEAAFDHTNSGEVWLPPVSNPGSHPHGRVAAEYITFMSDNLPDRFPYSFREMQTAEWLVGSLLAMGYPQSYISIQEFTFDEVRHLSEMSFFMDLFLFIHHSPFVNLDIRPSEKSQNIILTIPGQSEEVIIVSAHYDGVFYPGASDNASGVALLLESAWRMQNYDNYYTVKYIFFGAEEAGIFGAYHYVAELTPAEHDNILFVINADVLLEGDDIYYMAGYSPGGGSHNPLLSSSSTPPGANHITESWDYIAIEVNKHYNLDVKAHPWGVFGPSDQLAFLPYGHTAMFLAGLHAPDGIPDGDINQHMMYLARVLHSPRDDIHYINENWPDKVETNMRAFSIFLEEMLLAKYYPDEN